MIDTSSAKARQARGYAAGVSRHLRRQGITTIPSGSESPGIHVTAISPTLAEITVDFADDRINLDTTESILDTLHNHDHQTSRLEDFKVHVHRNGGRNDSSDLRHD